jgi:hypothetical protein
VLQTTQENAMPSPERAKTEQLLVNLVRELYQTETSAAVHCRREAARLGDAPPAQTMRAISDHAKLALAELPALCEREGLPVSLAGSFTGSLFSELRDKVFDRLIQSERSYRGTLLGTRHGIDVVKMVELTADAAHNVGIVSFCQGWLTTRTVLVQRAEEAMSWFAQHPEQASSLARPPLMALRSRFGHA